jgi:hypothetical protein
MSAIHWEKSVLSLHLKEVIEDHQRGDRTALVGMATVLLGSIVISNGIKVSKPILKSIIKMAYTSQIKSNKSRKTVMNTIKIYN